MRCTQLELHYAGLPRHLFVVTDPQPRRTVTAWSVTVREARATRPYLDFGAALIPGNALRHTRTIAQATGSV